MLLNTIFVCSTAIMLTSVFLKLHFFPDINLLCFCVNGDAHFFMVPVQSFFNMTLETDWVVF